MKSLKNIFLAALLLMAIVTGSFVPAYVETESPATVKLAGQTKPENRR